MVEPRNTTTIKEMLGEVRDDLVLLLEDYESKFGVGPVWIVSVPARICLAADHTDYWMGFSPELLTMGSDSQVMWGVIGPRSDNRIFATSSDEAFQDWDSMIGVTPNVGDDWLEWLESKGTPPPHWSNYVVGSVCRTKIDYEVSHGFNLYISSTIPPASGASSSSALATIGMVAVRLSNGLPMDRNDVVHATSEGEWYCGTRGGMQDHATMLFAKEGYFLKLNFRPFSYSYIAEPENMRDVSWVTIFTHPSDKGGGVLTSFNKLSITAREIVPTMLGEWDVNGWSNVHQQLPNVISLSEFCAKNDCGSLKRLYPNLFENGDEELKIKDRFLFAMRERERCISMQNEMAGNRCKPENIGALMSQSWVDADSLYGIRTRGMDEVAESVFKVDGVHGIKVMGAGFGGNILALCDKGVEFSSISSPYEKHQPGPGLSILNLDDYLTYSQSRHRLAAVILCGGRGSRMQLSGIQEHKPLIPLHGVTSTRRVVEMLSSSELDFQQVILVTPPDLVSIYQEKMAGLPVEVVAQKDALGTGNAVYCALKSISKSVDHVYVTFGTQPLVRPQSIRAALHQHVESEAGLTLPTTIRANPYAPLVRNESGEVTGSLETHLDGVEMPEWGETNVGGYWTSTKALNEVLIPLHDELFNSETTLYDTSSGELGFPNEMTKGCLNNGFPVIGHPCADPEEVIGLKVPEHIDEIESWLDSRNRWKNDWSNL